MIVYLEYAIIDNMVMNSVILILSSLTLKEKVKKGRVFFAALVGTIGAILMSLFSMEKWYGISLKLLLGLIMVVIMVFKPTKRRLISYYCVFLAYTFILGGCILSLLYLLEADVTDALAITYVSGVPVGVLIGGVAVTIWLAYFLIKRIYKKKKVFTRLVDVEITLDKVYALKGFVDSGNLLRYNGLPVYFAVNRKIKEKLFEMYSRNLLSSKETAFIPYRTVKGEGRALSIKPMSFKIEGKNVECYIAWCGIKGEDDYDFIVGEQDD